MATLREQVEAYVTRVKSLADHVKGNEQATKQSLIGPFFTMLGYDLTDPRECMPEYKADFGKDRSVKPIDWAFLNNGAFAFFVEAKEVGKRLGGFDEQLADYFAKDPAVKLGILTNGAQWRFFTDVVNANVMDRDPFAKWDVFGNEAPPFDVLTLLQKASFNPELIRAFAQRQRAQNLLVGELSRLLEPADEFTKLAVANLETRMLTRSVVEGWKPVVASALDEWARQRMLTAALTPPVPEEQENKVVTTEEELAAFGAIEEMLGPDRPIGWEDSLSYFKIYAGDRKSRVFVRLGLERKNPVLWVPLPQDAVSPHADGRALANAGGWTSVALADGGDVRALKGLLLASHSAVTQAKGGAEAS